MDRESLVDAVIRLLCRADFDVSSTSAPANSTFDAIARRERELLIVKVILRREDVDRSMANEIKVLSSTLDASPIIIISSSRSGTFQDGVLYLRYGLSMMTLGTLYDHLVEGVPPMVFYGQGGHCVTLDGPTMRLRREESGISLGQMAEVAGVSRKAIQMYETGMGCDINVALIIEERLGIGLIRPLDPFGYSKNVQRLREQLELVDSNKRGILNQLSSLGLEIIPTVACPFDALARKDTSLLLTSVGRRGSELNVKAGALSEVSRIAGRDSLLIVRGRVTRKNIGGTPVISTEEIRRSLDLESILAGGESS